MSEAYLSVVDATTGAPIEGAAVYFTVNTTCCPGCVGSCSCWGCTSGDGYEDQANTDASGQASFTFAYNCSQSVDVQVTAQGYSPTTDNFSTGSITGDVNLGTVQMVPTSNVPGSNQGGSGSAQGAGSAANKALGDLTGAATGVGLEVLIVGVVAVIVIVIILVALG